MSPKLALKSAEKDTLLAEAVAVVQAGNMRSASRPAVQDVEIDAVERELRISLPPSYRKFIKLCGAGRVGSVDVFGLPRNDLWGDIVLMNHLVDTTVPREFVKFAGDWTGQAYYFDTTPARPGCEWPVVVLEPSGSPRRLASSFLDFLGRLIQGPITVELKKSNTR